MTTKTNSSQLDQLIHDVNSKCASLKSAAVLLRTASPEEIKEFLSLMAREAEALQQSIEQYRKEFSTDELGKPK